MERAFRLLFNLYPGEGRKAGFFLLLGLLWSMGGYGIFTLSEGMFLEHVGAESLPQSYFAIAGSMCLLSLVLIFLLNRISIRVLLFSLIAFWVVVNCGLFFFLHTPSTTFWFFFKALGWTIPLSTYIVYWAFVDQYYDLQDAKRFFCLFNAVIFLGDALGSSVLSFLLSAIGTEMVLALFTLALLLSLPVVLLIYKRVPPVLEDQNEHVDGVAFLKPSHVIKGILQSRFTLYLVLFYFLMQLVAVATEYNYMGFFQKTLGQERGHAITEFLGTCGMWISLGNMCLAMLFYGRLVKKFGINNLILVAPSLFMVVFTLWICREALPLAVLGMVAREGLVYTFDDNNLNLLITGVPSKIKSQVRISIESFIEPVGMFFAALLLLFFKESHALLGLILAALAAICVLFLRKSYPSAIFSNLVASAIRFDKKASEWLKEMTSKDKKQTEFDLLTHLKRPDEKQQLLAFEYLLKIGSLAVLPHLLNHLGRLSLPGKLKAIELLRESRFAKESSVIERLERWRRILPHPLIKSAIHFYFASHGILRPEKVMHDLHNEHLGIRAAAILSLKTNPYGIHLPSFYSLASDKLKLLLQSTHAEEICMGLKILELEKDCASFEAVFAYLCHPCVPVTRSAAKAVFELASPKHSDLSLLLVSRLGAARDVEVRKTILLALEKMAGPNVIRELILSSNHFRSSEKQLIERIILRMGPSVSLLLLEIVQEKKVPDRARLLAGKILGKLNSPILRSDLYKIVHKEIERAYFYFYHAKTIQKQVPEHDLTILENALMTGFFSIIDFIIQLLGIAGSIEECEVLSHSLRSKNRKLRAQAVESLEKTCDSRIFALLEPLIDQRSDEDKLKLYLLNGGMPLHLTQLLDAMNHSPSFADQIVSIGLKARLKTPDWRKTLQEKLDGKEEIFHHFAAELLQSQAAL